MDPLSIAASASGIVTLCFQVTTSIYTFVDDARKVDSNVNDLIREISGLSRVLEAISQSWTQNPVIATQELGENNLWDSVRASLDDCKSTLLKLDKKLDDVQKASFLGRGFLRKPTKSVKLSMSMKDILTFKQQIHSYNNAMQSALQMINVCLLINSNSSQESIAQVLAGLKIQIGRVESTLHKQINIESSSPGLRDDSEDVSHNLLELVKKAQSFHSNASSILGGDARSTIWAESVMGEPLTNEQYSNINSWITLPNYDDDASIEDGAFRVASLDLETFTNDAINQSSDESDADSDIEKHFTKKFKELAMISLEHRDYPRAEVLLKTIVDRTEDKDQTKEKDVITNLTLAFVYGLQEKWNDAEKVIIPLSMAKGINSRMVFVGLEALAVNHLQKGDLDTAIKYCKRAVWGFRKILGEKSPSYFESMALLAHIYDSNDNNIDAEVCRSFLPTGFKLSFQTKPSDYLQEALFPEASLSTAQDHRSKLLQPITHLHSPQGNKLNMSKSPLEQNMRQLIVGIDFGTTDSAVAFAFVDSSETGKHVEVVNEWPVSGSVDFWSYTSLGRHDDPKPRVNTRLYYDKDGKVIGWGFDAPKSLDIDGYMKTNITLVTEFKFRFMPRSRVNQSLIPPPFSLKKSDIDAAPINLDFPTLPSGKSITDVTADYLRELRKAVQAHLAQQIGQQVLTDIWENAKYCFSVPSSWDGAGRKAFRTAIVQAGFLREIQVGCLDFVTEHEVVLTYYMKEEGFSVEAQDIFLIVDAGRQMVDLGAVEVLNGSPPTFVSCTAASWDTCGSAAILRTFGNILSKKIRKMKLPEGSGIAGRIYIKSMAEIKNRILAELRGQRQNWAVDLSKEPEFSGVGIKDGCPIFTEQEVKACFDSVFNRITAMIKDQISKITKEGKTLKKILLFGSFATSDYLLETIQNDIPPHLRDIVVRLKDCESTVAKGAAMMGIDRMFPPAMKTPRDSIP